MKKKNGKNRASFGRIRQIDKLIRWNV